MILKKSVSANTLFGGTPGFHNGTLRVPFVFLTT